MTESKVVISTDSAADLGDELLKKFNIQVARLGIVIGDKLHTDGIDITPDDIYQAVEKQNIVPKTSAINDTDYETLFKKWTEGGKSLVHINISDKLSACHSSAKRAAERVKNVYVIDSKALSTGIGLLAVKAAELRDQGKSARVIAEEVEASVPKMQCSFVLDTLKYMHKGGRCSGFKLFGANLLAIHPQLFMEKDGRLIAGKNFKGKLPAVVKQYAKYILDSFPNADKDFAVFVTHTVIDPEIEKETENTLREAGFKRIFNTYAGSTITVHCGKGCIGVLFLNK